MVHGFYQGRSPPHSGDVPPKFIRFVENGLFGEVGDLLAVVWRRQSPDPAWGLSTRTCLFNVGDRFMHSSLTRTAASLMVAAALVGGTAAQAHDIVRNGGFESGDFLNWNTSGDQSFNGVDTGSPHTGAYAAFFGTVSATIDRKSVV